MHAGAHHDRHDLSSTGSELAPRSSTIGVMMTWVSMKSRRLGFEENALCRTKNDFWSLLQNALENIREPRFFETERGYQGELLVQLGKRLKDAAFPGDPIVEQEYQKTIPSHRINIRPDIIIHIPFGRGRVGSREEGNFVAIELKRCSTKKEAEGDFANLAQMHKALRYPLTIFINIDSDETHAGLCPKSIASQTICFAVRLEDGKPFVRAEKYNQSKKGRD